jgi:hypothetical protein
MREPKHPSRPKPQRPKPEAAPCRDSLAEALERQPAWVKAELDALRKHETTVLRALSDDENRALFLRDPALLLSKLKLDVSGPLRQKLRGDPSPADLSKPIAFRLPNGQVLRPRVNVRFVKEGS